MVALLVRYLQPEQRSAVAQHERDPVRGGDKLDAGDAVFEYPLRPARGTEDGALRLGVAVEPRLVGGTACVSAELQRLADGRLDLAIGASRGAQKTQDNYCTICCTISDTGGLTLEIISNFLRLNVMT
jgi:hypothetical protein